MAAEWFYTTNKQQMGPVSWEELRELAENGILKSNDMVWSEGMDEWIKAFKQKGLFAENEDKDSDDDTPRSKKSRLSKPPGSRRSARDDDDDDDEEDAKTTRRRRRQEEESSAKTKVGLKVGLIIAGVVCFLLFLMCAGGVIAFITLGAGGGGAPVGKGPHTYSEFNLPAQRIANPRRFQFTQGKRVIVTSTNQLQLPNTDVDLFVYRGNEKGPIGFDERVPQETKHCRVEFIVPTTGTYRIELRNLGPGTATRCDVRIEEH